MRKSHNKKHSAPLILLDMPRQKTVAESQQRCSVCGQQMLGQSIAKEGESALRQCDECAQEHQRKEFEPRGQLLPPLLQQLPLRS